MKRISVLGSTGSIGRNTLQIAGKFPDRLQVAALAAARNVTRLAEQILQFEPEVAAVLDAPAADELKSLLPGGCKTEIVFGPAG
jgi:1-deoxy-D-xylulose-5-phosphate reductoisomerase